MAAKFPQLIYVVIARGKDTVLCEYTNTSKGNNTKKIFDFDLLTKLEPNQRVSLQTRDKIFHVFGHNDLYYICLVEAEYSDRVAFVFFKEI